VGKAAAGIVVRDTTNRDGVMLAFPPRAWLAFAAELRAS